MTDDAYEQLLRKEITPKEYVARVREAVNRRLGLAPSKFGRGARRHYISAG